MVGTKTRTRFDARKVSSAARKGNITSLGHAGAAIRLTARRSIKKHARPSPKGTPPHTRAGRLRNALKYAVEKAIQSVVIGPDVEVAGTSGKAHEFGGHFRNEQYPRRPFMGPALDKTRDRLPAMWANSVKG
ncbi:hypothetical protein [Fontivita pretiosa]|uniref:hypothetical protein n=1 Tax=Fontivita pretiosa TaxID=2989684 RepID=UPI003D17635C